MGAHRILGNVRIPAHAAGRERQPQLWRGDLYQQTLSRGAVAAKTEQPSRHPPLWELLLTHSPRHLSASDGAFLRPCGSV
eukprot:3240626-Rhodomonas_salina.2